MKILQIIHGYPPYYMAGSEVYTYNLSRELAKNDDIFIFTRIENPFEQPYNTYDENNDGIKIHRVNKPLRDYTLEDKYLDEKIDNIFIKYVKRIQPDVIHIGHLSHLSTNIVNIAKEQFNLPVVYTIHDFWLFCYRGQMIDLNMKLCSNPDNENCLNCAKFKFKDKVDIIDINEYKNHMKKVVNNIDVFLSPSMFLKRFFEKMGVPPEKIRYSKYGFDTNAIQYKKKSYDPKSNINFGYTGRIIPVKGIKLLLEAFSEIDNANLLIFGDASPLEKYLEPYSKTNIHFKGGYKNWEINDILEQIDVLIVPSLWYENSPLVIQEAYLAGIPVITSNIGGMAELVEDNVDGFTFEVGNKSALRRLITNIIKNPTLLNSLNPGKNKVRSIEDDAQYVHSVYKEVLKDE